MRRILFLLFFAVMMLSHATLPHAQDAAPYAHVVTVKGVISPATYYHIRHHLEEAAEEGAAVVVLALDTPGGLYDSTQQIIQAILESPVPVATYVSPAGGHAASAGTYILYASHIAAMAPGTNIGAATPVNMAGQGAEEKPESKGTSDTLKDKMVNDAAAYIRTLGELRGRNLAFADKAVRNAATVTASEALAQKIIDAVAEDIPALLEKIDGRTVKMSGGGTLTLKTKGAVPKAHEPDWRTKILSLIGHPNIAFLLMSLGMYGLIYELANPGAFVPGVIGAICLLLGLFAMNVLPVNTSGIALLGLGVALMTGEAFAPSFGVLGIGGAIAFAAGAVMLIDSTTPGFGVDIWIIALMTLTSLGVLSVLLAMAVRAQKRRVTTGDAELLDAPAVVLDWARGRGTVQVTGEVWSAVAGGDFIIKKGDSVKVTARDGLELTVAPNKSHAKEKERTT